MNARLALKEGALITVVGDSTACTLILDNPHVDTFSFDEVRILYVEDDPQYLHEAATTYARVKSRLGHDRSAA